MIPLGDDLTEWIRARNPDGKPLAELVTQFAETVGVSERTVWRWLKGKPPCYANALKAQNAISEIEAGEQAAAARAAKRGSAVKRLAKSPRPSHRPLQQDVPEDQTTPATPPLRRAKRRRSA